MPQSNARFELVMMPLVGLLERRHKPGVDPPPTHPHCYSLPVAGKDRLARRDRYT